MNAYWQQWSQDEIDSMLGRENNIRMMQYEKLDEEDETHHKPSMINEYELSLENLGMSWKDFY